LNREQLRGAARGRAKGADGNAGAADEPRCARGLRGAGDRLERQHRALARCDESFQEKAALPDGASRGNCPPGRVLAVRDGPPIGRAAIS